MRLQVRLLVGVHDTQITGRERCYYWTAQLLCPYAPLTDRKVGEKPWADRKALVVNELKYNTMYNAEAFVCLQEVLNAQLTDVMGGLGSDGKRNDSVVDTYLL
jgi:hypothetical protein